MHKNNIFKKNMKDIKWNSPREVALFAVYAVIAIGTGTVLGLIISKIIIDNTINKII